MSDGALSVLQVNTTDVGGGAAAIAFGHHRELRSRGQDAWLAVGAKRSSDPHVFEIANAEYRTGWARRMERIADTLTPVAGRIPGAGRARSLIRELGTPRAALNRRLGRDDYDFPATSRLLSSRSRGPDILHLHNLHGGYFDLRALPALTAAVPTLITLHDAWMLSGHCAYSIGCGRWEQGCGKCPDLRIAPAVPRDATASNWNRKSEIYSATRLTVVSPSDWLAALARRSLLARAATDFCVIPNGIDRERFKPGDRNIARDRLGLSHDVHVLLFAANGIRNNLYKDFPTLRAGVATLAKALGSARFEFIGVGDDGPTEHFENGSIRFVPHVDREQLVNYYQAADLYVHAARADNFPNTILEALCCGTPVVATAVGGISEQVRSFEGFDSGLKTDTFAVERATGILVPAADSERLGRAAASLLSNPDILRRFRSNAAADAAARFDIDLQSDRYMGLYDQMLSKRALAS